MNLQTTVKFILAFIAIFIINGLAIANNVTIPGGGGGGSQEIISTMTSKYNDFRTVAGLVIGGLGVLSALIGAGNYTLKRWQQGHWWMAGSAIGLLAGGLVIAWAQLWV